MQGSGLLGRTVALRDQGVDRVSPRSRWMSSECLRGLLLARTVPLPPVALAQVTLSETDVRQQYGPSEEQTSLTNARRLSGAGSHSGGALVQKGHGPTEESGT